MFFFLCVQIEDGNKVRERIFSNYMLISKIHAVIILNPHHNACTNKEIFLLAPKAMIFPIVLWVGYIVKPLYNGQLVTIVFAEVLLLEVEKLLVISVLDYGVFYMLREILLY